MSYWTDIIPKDWGYETLKSSVSNIVDNRGKTCPTATFGTPLIATNCIKEFALYPVFEKLRYVDDHTIKNWFRGHPEPNDILFVNKGTPGGVCIVPDPVPFCIAQDMVALRADPKKFNWKYLFTALRSNFVKSQIEALNVGTSIPHLKKTDFDRIVIPRPDLKIQQSIGEIYFSICEKIENNLQMNKTLEEMAMALYKHWFVDFGPFQDGEFEDSELGEIPMGWEVKPIGEVIETLGGGTPKTKISEYWENGTIDWYSPTDLTKANSLYSLGTAKKITPKGLEKSSAKLFPKNSLLMSSRATIGAITINRKEACTNQGFITMIPNDLLSLYQLHGWTVSNMNLIISKANGSTFKEISKTNFRNLPILIGKDISPYINQAISIYSQIENNIVENETLTTLRDTLLPKLISGEVRVKDIEKTLSEVL